MTTTPDEPLRDEQMTTTGGPATGPTADADATDADADAADADADATDADADATDADAADR